jgi:hypothetical protein
LLIIDTMAVADPELNPEPTTCDVESWRLLLHTPTCAQTTGRVIFPCKLADPFDSIAFEIESKREAIVIPDIRKIRPKPQLR